MIIPFDFECSRQIIFGPGSLKRLSGLAHEYGHQVAVITGSRWIYSTPYIDDLKTSLSDFNSNFFPCAEGEPTLDSIREMLPRIKSKQPSLIVAIGGGSVLDTAKAVSALIREEEDPADYLEGIGKGKVISGKGTPWIAIPTTSGTGSEATKNAVIRSIEHGVKKSLRSSFLLPTHVIIDPELTQGLSLRITGMTGMDALVQLFEAYVSTKRKPLPCALIHDAFPVMLSSLKQLVHEPDNLDARTGASYGAFISGVSLANSGL